MAATISVNFATVQDVFSVSPSPTKSVSSKVLADALGGGVVGGGYVRRTGDAMTGYLTLTSKNPTQDYHAVPKKYIDDFAFTTRYTYFTTAPTNVISGADIFNNTLNFNEQLTNTTVGRYIDVYRDGVLLRPYRDPNNIGDYRPTILQYFPTTNVTIPPKIEFTETIPVSSNVQVMVGGKGPMPAVVGVSRIIEGKGGTKLSPLMGTGDVTVTIVPVFSATPTQTAGFTSDATTILPFNRTGLKDTKYITPKTFDYIPGLPQCWFRGSRIQNPIEGAQVTYQTIDSFRIASVTFQNGDLVIAFSQEFKDLFNVSTTKPYFKFYIPYLTTQETTTSILDSDSPLLGVVVEQTINSVKFRFFSQNVTSQNVEAPSIVNFFAIPVGVTGGISTNEDSNII